MAELEAYKAEPNKMTHSLNKCLQGKKKNYLSCWVLQIQ